MTQCGRSRMPRWLDGGPGGERVLTRVPGSSCVGLDLTEPRLTVRDPRRCYGSTRRQRAYGIKELCDSSIGLDSSRRGSEDHIHASGPARGPERSAVMEPRPRAALLATAVASVIAFAPAIAAARITRIEITQ